MFYKFQILFTLHLVTKHGGSSEIKFANKPYHHTLNNFWVNSYLDSGIQGGEIIFISAPVRSIDNQLRLGSKINPNTKKFKLVPRLVPKEVGGFPGIPVVCYYCNVVWGTAGHYPGEDAATDKPTPCSWIKAACGEEGQRTCCSTLECAPDTAKGPGKYCRFEKKKCHKNGESCTDPREQLPCCSGGKCIEGLCEPPGCRKPMTTCNTGSDCCWKASACSVGGCVGCLTIDEGGGKGIYACKRDKDCCGDLVCGDGKDYAKGRCH